MAAHLSKYRREENTEGDLKRLKKVLMRKGDYLLGLKRYGYITCKNWLEIEKTIGSTKRKELTFRKKKTSK